MCEGAGVEVADGVIDLCTFARYGLINGDDHVF